MNSASTIDKCHKLRRRGSIYAPILGVSTLVMIIGLSALVAVRIERRTAAAELDTVKAGLMAESMVEIALARLSDDPGWRSTYSHDQWTAVEKFGGADVRFKLVDQADTDLTDDASDPFRLFGEATVDESVRVYSVLVMPSGKTNLLSNAGMESGTSGWVGNVAGTVTLEILNDDPHAGSSYLVVKNRPSALSGVSQDVTSSIKNGTTYDCETWFKGHIASGTVSITLILNTTSGQQSTTIAVPWSGVGVWQKISRALQPVWTGTLTSAYFHISDDTGSNDDFSIDDAWMSGPPMLRPVFGSWRREPSS